MNTVNKLSESIAAVLRANAAERRLNQTALAKLAGLSQPTVSRVLDNKRALKFEELVMICDGMELDLAAVIAEAKRVQTANPGEPIRVITG